MSYFVIVRGPLGCGKSTIARELSKVLGAGYVPMDEVLEKHGLDRVSPDAECIPAENFIQANEIVLPQMQQRLRRGGSVIFDACYYHREVIEHLRRNLSFPGYVFTLKAPLEVCIARDGQREKSHGADAARAVYQLVSRFDEGVVIDVTKPLDTIIQEILSHLPEN